MVDTAARSSRNLAVDWQCQGPSKVRWYVQLRLDPSFRSDHVRTSPGRIFVAEHFKLESFPSQEFYARLCHVHNRLIPGPPDGKKVL